jgi:hypothetical protein
MNQPLTIKSLSLESGLLECQILRAINRGELVAVSGKIKKGKPVYIIDRASAEKFLKKTNNRSEYENHSNFRRVF